MSSDLPNAGWWETGFRWTIKWVVRLLILFLFLIILAPILGRPFFQFFFLLLCGWAQYLFEVVPQIAFNAEIASGAGVALVLGLYGLHRILCWWMKWQSGPSTSWQWGWTWKITAMALLLFATSIAATGIVHQIGWLARASRLVEDRSRGRQTRALAMMKQLSLSLRFYADDHDGKYPKTLEELLPTFVYSAKLLFVDLEPGEAPQRILYFGSDSGTYPPEFIILASPYPLSGKRILIHADTAGELIPEAQYQTQMQKQRR